MRLLTTTFLLLFAMLALAGLAHAQYVPIPNEQSGAQCPGSIDQCSGFKIRADINAKFSALGSSDCQWTVNGSFQCTKLNGAPLATGFPTGLMAQNAIPIAQTQPSNAQCLQYQASSNTFIFGSCGAGGATGLTFGSTTLNNSLTPPTNGQCLQSNGTQIVGGACGGGGGGTVTLVQTASPLSGTVATTGTLSCPTCATTTNGGALSGTAPIAVSAAGVISGGGLGTVNGALKGNGSGTITQAACADLSNGAASCSTDTTNASNISSGNLAIARIANALTTPGPIGGTTPGTAAFSSLKDTGVTGSSQCLHADSTGAIAGTGADCASGLSGLTTNKIPKASSATTIADSSVSDNGTTVSTTEPVSSNVFVTPPQTATYSSSTATFDASAGSEATLTISANVTITLSGCTAGQHLFLKLKYTGSFTPTFAVGGSDTLNFNANGAPTFTAANSKTDIIGFDCQSNGSGIDYDALPASLGYSH